jgi:hypothetical protein
MFSFLLNAFAIAKIKTPISACIHFGPDFRNISNGKLRWRLAFRNAKDFLFINIGSLEKINYYDYLPLTYNKKFNAKNFVNAGFYTDLYNTAFEDSIDSYGTGFVTLRNYTGKTSLMRIFAQWQHQFNDRFSLNTGLSYQFLTLNNSQAPEPRLGLKYVLTKKQSLSFGAGMHSQVQPLYIYFATANFGNGLVKETNRNLDFSKAIHTVLAYDVNIFDNARI